MERVGERVVWLEAVTPVRVGLGSTWSREVSLSLGLGFWGSGEEAEVEVEEERREDARARGQRS